MKSVLSAQTLRATLVVASLVVASYLFFDRPAALFAQSVKHSGAFDLAKMLSLAANGTFIFSLLSVGIVISAVNLLGSSPKNWARELLRICLTVCAAIALVESLKFMFGRCRPALFLDEDRYGFTWFSSKDVFNSFPSGHTTRIFAVCAALALRFRRLTIWLYGFAALVGASRVFALKHYPSDVLAGAFLGVIVAVWARELCKEDQAL